MRSLVFILALLPNATTANDAGFGTHTRELNSIDGNQVQISMSAETFLSDAVFVSLCIHVPRTHKAAKGIATQAHLAQFASPGAQACLPVAATAQNIMLLTTTRDGDPRRSIGFMADLTGQSGQTLNIEWTIEVLN
ncbi:hypothetical protein [Planktotalea sp.]|uniref:hypothetical protein n=1 Tax=Planktotalea sp. TaxID=2029877 RepID=UPI003299D51E